MKITIKGEVTDKWSKSYSKKDGSKGFNGFLLIKVGEYNGNEELQVLEAYKPEHLEDIKKLALGSKIEANAYLNCNSGQNDKGKFAFTKLSLASFTLENTEAPPVQTQVLPTQTMGNDDDDLPF